MKVLKYLLIFWLPIFANYQPDTEFILNDQNRPTYLKTAGWEQSIVWKEGHIVQIDAIDPLGETTSHYTYENGYLADDSTSHYSYDCEGNRTDTTPSNLSFEMNEHGKISEIQSEQHLVCFDYDQQGRRIKRSSGTRIEYYLWEEGREVGKLDSQGRVIEYKKDYTSYSLLFLDNRTWIAPLNHRKDILGLIDPNSGEIVAVARYSSWGERTWYKQRDDAPQCPWGFNGARIDPDLGLLLFEHRIYDPSSGRWLTEDPMGPLDHENPMVYSRNDPISRNEVLGLFSIQAGWQFLDRNIPVATSSLRFLEELGQDFWDRHTDISLRSGIGEGIVDLTGWGAPPNSRSKVGKGEISDQVRVCWINGMLNYHDDSLSTAGEICLQHGGNNVHYIHMSTYGFSGDLTMVGWHKLNLKSYSVKMLVKLWRELIEEMGGIDGGGKIIHYCHSAGATVTSVARAQLSQKELAMLEIHTFGGPTLVDGATNYLAHRDPIGWIGRLAYFFLHPLGGGSATIEWLPSEGGIFDHPMSSLSYKKKINKLGHQFVKQYGTLLDLNHE